MTVFRIYFCGTEGKASDYLNSNYADGELVSKLYELDPGIPYRDKIIVDGVGSGDLQLNAPTTNHRCLWVERNASGTNKSVHNTGGKFAQISGAGWGMNVRHAMAVVKAEPVASRNLPTGRGSPVFFAKTRGRIDSIVLIGWSRGAITCHMMANQLALDPDTSAYPVRIFAVDPVTGRGNGFDKNRNSVPKTVNEYFGVYARDERSTGFDPMVPIMDGTFNALVLPGRHASVVGNNSVFGDGNEGHGTGKYLEPGKITRHWATVKLKEWGVRLHSSGTLSDLDLLGCYHRLEAEDSVYAGMRNWSALPGGRFETFAKSITTDVDGERSVTVGGDLLCLALSKVGKLNQGNQENNYINWHHRQLAEKLSTRQRANAMTSPETRQRANALSKSTRHLAPAPVSRQRANALTSTTRLGNLWDNPNT